MLVTTLNKIRKRNPTKYNWKLLLSYLGKTGADDEPLPFSVIVEATDIEFALWCCRSAPEYNKEWRLFAVWCARRVQHLMKDKRLIDCIDVAERFANGEVDRFELAKARNSVRNDAFGLESYKEYDVAWNTARNSASSSAYYSALLSSGIMESNAARHEAWGAQKEQFLKIAG